MLTNVLLYGRDPQLLDTRQLLLERAGYSVSELSSMACIAPIKQIDLLILCHSLSIEDNGRAIGLVRSRWPFAKTLSLTRGASGSSERSVREVFEAADGPSKLLDTVSWLLRADAVHGHRTQKAEWSRVEINSPEAVLPPRGMMLSIASEYSVSQAPPKSTNITSRRRTTMAQYAGKVSWFNNAKGYGFLAREGGPDVFVHYSSIQLDCYKTLKEGDPVEIDVIQGDKGPQADKVVRMTQV